MTTSNLEAAASTVDEGLADWRMLDELMTGRLAECFARVEPRRQARKYVVGLISDLPRKNCWALAEQAGDQTSDRMQRLLERAALVRPSRCPHPARLGRFHIPLTVPETA